MIRVFLCWLAIKIKEKRIFRMMELRRIRKRKMRINSNLKQLTGCTYTFIKGYVKYKKKKGTLIKINK